MDQENRKKETPIRKLVVSILGEGCLRKDILSTKQEVDELKERLELASEDALRRCDEMRRKSWLASFHRISD